jgi:hypothetical protein
MNNLADDTEAMKHNFLLRGSSVNVVFSTWVTLRRPNIGPASS